MEPWFLLWNSQLSLTCEQRIVAVKQKFEDSVFDNCATTWQHVDNNINILERRPELNKFEIVLILKSVSFLKSVYTSQKSRKGLCRSLWMNNFTGTKVGTRLRLYSCFITNWEQGIFLGVGVKEESLDEWKRWAEIRKNRNGERMVWRGFAGKRTVKDENQDGWKAGGLQKPWHTWCGNQSALQILN